MKLKSLPPNVNLLHRLSDENEKIEMGIYPVMFGFRVRAGFFDYPVVELDWCCGGNLKFLNDMYFSLAIHLDSIDEKEFNPVRFFKSLPGLSRVKPAHKDPDFMNKLEEIIDFKPIVKMHIESPLLKSLHPIIL